VHIVVSSEFECPACRQFHLRALRPLLEEFGPRVGFAYRHFPLEYHTFARAAAQAAECAATAERFFQMHDVIFEYQDALGLKPFAELAALAGVEDVEAFEACRRSPEAPRIAYDLSVARELALTGTPGVIVDGILLGVVPDSAQLRALVEAKLAGLPAQSRAGR
jgi:protein-disulfide isomerase